MKSLLIKPFARFIASRVNRDRRRAVEDQERIFKQLVAKAIDTKFGRDHGFTSIRTVKDFQSQVPVRNYEETREYFDMVKEGSPNILWPGRPKYLAKTSGTTSGAKYIPITTDSLPNHIHTARNALFNYASRGKNARLFDGKVIFLSGSPVMTRTGGIWTGRLSGIVNHEVPAWLKGNQLPAYDTNCIEDWEEKVDRIVVETYRADLRLISGIPPWVQMYFERLLDYTGMDSVMDVFPRLQLFIYGGVNYEPYRHSLESIIGTRIDSLETYPASEGFLAFQDLPSNEGLLLNTNSGIFYEFIRLDDFHSRDPRRFTLKDVEEGVDYAVIVSNNAGLWAYNLGDTVRFVSRAPYRLVVSGRVSHFISAFGEHVIAKEVEEAMLQATEQTDIAINEFTVAPLVNPPDGSKPHHEWFVEFERMPRDMDDFANRLDASLRNQNIYYDDLIRGSILRPLVVRPLALAAFRQLMKKRGKLGGQNKVPRLSNDRKIAQELINAGLVK